MKRIYIIIATICLIAANSAADAQAWKITSRNARTRYLVHEFSLYASGGLANIGFNLDREFNSYKMNVGFGAGFNYAYNFNENFAVVTGVGFETFSGKLSFSGHNENYVVYDNNGVEFLQLFDTLHGEYNETQKIVLLTVPVMARYSTPAGNNSAKYYLSGGFKLGIPFIATSTITPETFSTAGHYYREARTYYNLPEYGFYNRQQGEQTKSNIKTGITPLLSFETGFMFAMGYSSDVCIGLYVDYCPVNIKKSKNDKHILEYQLSMPTQYLYYSALNTATVRKATLFGSGLKIGISF
jgi:hypothetical protein